MSHPASTICPNSRVDGPRGGGLRSLVTISVAAALPRSCSFPLRNSTAGLNTVRSLPNSGVRPQSNSGAA
jgi:hypothetical protein